MVRLWVLCDPVHTSIRLSALNLKSSCCLGDYGTSVAGAWPYNVGTAASRLRVYSCCGSR
jgi:hypothetical protein